VATLVAIGCRREGVPDRAAGTVSLGTAHRLSAVELQATAREVLGVDVSTLSYLPSVPPVLGFEHLDGVVVDDVARVEGLERWARSVVASRRESVPVAPASISWRGPDLDWDEGATALLADASFSVFHAAGAAMHAVFEVPADGTYDASVVARVAWRDEAAGFTLWVDDRPVGSATGPTPDAPGEAFLAVSAVLSLTAGPHAIRLEPSFVRPVPLEVPPPPRYLDDDGPWLAFDRIDLDLRGDGVVRPPIGPAVACIDGDGACLRETLGGLGERLWRRPLTTTELDAAVDVVAQASSVGARWDDATDEAVVALMLAPPFAWLPGRDAASVDEEGRDLRPWYLAAQGSYAVWQAPPDAELLACAAAGLLASRGEGPCAGPTQWARLFADPRSDVLVTELSERWLGVHDVGRLDFITRAYPLWSSALMSDLHEEFRDRLRGDRAAALPVRGWFTGSSGFATGRVARYYGDATGSLLTRHAFGRGADRPGILGMGWVATAWARGTEPSVVDPAVWVLEHLLCRPPPAPPPGVPQLPPGADPRTAVQAHASDPACASCHAGLDPYGVPLLGFDAIGQRRGFAPERIVLPDGTAVDGPASYSAYLADSPEVERCVAKHVAAWVWRREPSASDAPRLLALAHEALHGGDGLDAWVRAAMAADPGSWGVP
jgi:hypothetical protein